MERERCDELRDALLDMVQELAYRGTYDGKPAYITGGLSALKQAFVVLGWSDPHPCPERACQYPGCNDWSSCGTPTKDGYRHVCGKHWIQLREGQ